MKRFLIKGNVDVLLITKTKNDVSFPVGQFLIEGSVRHIGVIVTRKVEAFCNIFLQT